MATPVRRWLPIVAGIVVLVGMVVVGVLVASLFWLREQATVRKEVAPAEVAAAFDEATRRFPDPRPAIGFDDDRRPRILDYASSRRNPGTITSLQAVAFEPRDRALARITLPFWLLRMKSGPIRFGEYVSGLEDRGVALTADDIENFGPGVLLDYSDAGGRRVLLSAQ
jgi:hypothetical protein